MRFGISHWTCCKLVPRVVMASPGCIALNKQWQLEKEEVLHHIIYSKNIYHNK